MYKHIANLEQGLLRWCCPSKSLDHTTDPVLCGQGAQTYSGHHHVMVHCLCPPVEIINNKYGRTSSITRAAVMVELVDDEIRDSIYREKCEIGRAHV